MKKKVIKGLFALAAAGVAAYAAHRTGKLDRLRTKLAS